MEQNEKLNIGVGNEEAVTLKPGTLKIVGVTIEAVGEKKADKVVCLCKHPDAENIIKISAVKYEAKGKLDTVGLWLNKDSKGLIRKGSALSIFMNCLGVKTPAELEGKDATTTTDDKGYLVFKAY